MRTLTAVAALLLLMTSGAGAGEGLTEAWKVQGLSNPESALSDPGQGVIYVSNVAGDPGAKDGKGFITRLSQDGKVEALEWATGLNAPKGMALVGDRLYVSDIDQLVAIDTKTGKVAKTWPAAGAKFLNDVAADESGRIYVSDMATNQIWTLDGDSLSVWVEDAALENPNGIKVADGKLIVATWGKMEPDWSTKVPGRLMTIDLASKKIEPLSSQPVGNLDGLEPDGAGGWYLSDWMAGGLFHASADGTATQIMDLKQGSADIGIIPSEKILLVPMMNEGELIGLQIE
jgi:hypothetical protein